MATEMSLKTFYENILRNAPLNFNNKEIQDIQIAVRQMLERVTAQINAEAESPFKISYIQPCGSMEEKASILKTKSYNYNGERLSKYIEFDYLAIIDKPDDVRLEGSCPACHFGPRFLLNQYDVFPLKLGFDDVFNRQLGRSTASLCSCFSLVSHRDEPYFSPRFSFVMRMRSHIFPQHFLLNQLTLTLTDVLAAQLLWILAA